MTARLRISLLAFGAALVLASCAPRIPAGGIVGPGAVREEISAELAGLQDAVNGRDVARFLQHYEPDSLRQREARGRFESIGTLDSLQCSERPGAVYVHGDTLEAVVQEEVTYHESGRVHVAAGWRTYKFARREGRWLIASDSERPWARARSTELAIDLQPDQGVLSGRARLDVRIDAPGEDRLLIRLNRGLEIREITGRGGKPLPYTRVADMVTVPIPASTRSLPVTVTFDGSLYNESKEQGYSQVGIGPAGSFASWVTNWYPHLAGIGSKSTGTIRYTAPAGVTVASSGRLARSSQKAGRTTQIFRIDAPLDFSFAAARYFHREEVVGGVHLGVYFLQGGDAKARLYLESCARVIAFLTELYGFYPFDGFSVVEIPSEAVGTLGGSSEQGMDLFPTGGLPDDRFPLPLLAHEIGHSWWGNLVSGRDGPVLDEALAQTTALLCVEALDGTRGMRQFLRRGYPGYPQSAGLFFRSFAGKPDRDLPIATPPAGADAASVLHDLADTKGFFVYEMLRETIGDAAFNQGLRAAVRTYARKEISLADLRRLWEKASGSDLGWFFDEWFYRRGAPEFKMTSSWSAARDAWEVSGTVTQEGEPYRVTADVVAVQDGRVLHTERLPITGAETPFRFRLDQEPAAVLFDPDYRILRWTSAMRNMPLLAEAHSSQASGRTAAAISQYREYVAAAPDALRGRSDLGACYLEADSLDQAQAQFDSVLDQARLHDADDPAVTRSMLGLGELADVRGKHDLARDWYAKVMSRPDESGTKAEAARYMDTPYVRKPPTVVDAAMLARCPGTYASAEGLTVEVTLTDSGVLKAAAGTLATDLLPLGGSTFKVAGDLGGEFNFAGGEGGSFTELVVTMGGRTFHLDRK